MVSVGAAEIAAPLDFRSVLLQVPHGGVVAHARKRRLHRFELRYVALQNFQFLAPVSSTRPTT